MSNINSVMRVVACTLKSCDCLIHVCLPILYTWNWARNSNFEDVWDSFILID